ncbi:ECF family sigma factor [Bordetella ansorpii]|uniref:ECF family sigma factor n=1 Tax=Bordetella ansorpii TaxID=288768 RepID=A0A157RBC5_9BORD|nr:RNA polymerase sigma factor [Bordetella ansorpii]SAI55154.1 ECF family sigma factor [Bordetella ansorpii]
MSVIDTAPYAGSGRERAARRSLQDYLCEHYRDLAQRLARRLGCADLASEALHDTWLRLQAGCEPEGMQGQADVPSGAPQAVRSPAAYLLRMAYCAAIDGLRAQARQPAVALDDNAEALALPDPLARTDEEAAGREGLRLLADAVESLPRRRRAIFVAARIEQRGRGEIAAMFGVSERIVDNELRRAHAGCAARLGRAMPAPVSRRPAACG